MKCRAVYCCNNSFISSCSSPRASFSLFPRYSQPCRRIRLEDSHAFCNRHIWLQSPYPSTKTPSLTLHSLSSFCAAGKTCLSYHSTFLPFFFLSSLCVAHCYKTFRRIPPPSPDDARLILLYRGKRLLYMGREFAPSGTKVFRNHRKFPAIFTMKKGRRRMVGVGFLSGIFSPDRDDF